MSSTIQIYKEQRIDDDIDYINRYLKGERVMKGRSTRIERDSITIVLLHLINDYCGIRDKGISVGNINYGMYVREKKRNLRYWREVRQGKRIDTRRGFDTERRRAER